MASNPIKENTAFWGREINRYIDLLGLKNWETWISLPEHLEGDRALTHRQPEARIAEFRVDVDWLRGATKKQISICAAHEVLHILLAQLYWLADKSNIMSKEQLAAIEHDIVRSLEKII